MKNELSLYDLVGKVEYFQNVFDSLDNNESLDSELLKEQAIKELFGSEKGLAKKTENIIQFIDFWKAKLIKLTKLSSERKLEKRVMKI